MRPATTTLLFPVRRRSGRDCRRRGRPRLQTREAGFGAPTGAAPFRFHRVLQHRYARNEPDDCVGLGGIIGYAHSQSADPCLLPSLPTSRLPLLRDTSAWWPPFRSVSVEWWGRGFFRFSASWRTRPAMRCGWHSLSAGVWGAFFPLLFASARGRFPLPCAAL